MCAYNFLSHDLKGEWHKNFSLRFFYFNSPASESEYALSSRIFCAIFMNMLKRTTLAKKQYLGAET